MITLDYSDLGGGCRCQCGQKLNKWNISSPTHYEYDKTVDHELVYTEHTCDNCGEHVRLYND